MQSELSLSEFRVRLQNNTQIGSPKLKLSPFGIFTLFDGSSKLFYGLFDDKSFRLTMNSKMSATFFIIKGRYKIKNRILDVNYNIEPSPKFYLIWIKWFPIFAGVVMNLLLFSKEAPKEVYILVNIFIVFIIFFSRWRAKRKRKKMEQKFIEIFEIIA